MDSIPLQILRKARSGEMFAFRSDIPSVCVLIVCVRAYVSVCICVYMCLIACACVHMFLCLCLFFAIAFIVHFLKWFLCP